MDIEDKYFRIVKYYLQSSLEIKIEFLKSKIQRDSYTIKVAYSRIQDIPRMIAEGKNNLDDHINKINIENWDKLVAERRVNELLFGEIWTNLHPKCESHPENMFVYLETTAELKCVGCEYQ